MVLFAVLFVIRLLPYMYHAALYFLGGKDGNMSHPRSLPQPLLLLALSIGITTMLIAVFLVVSLFALLRIVVPLSRLF